jgi:hypothetical protein
MHFHVEISESVKDGGPQPDIITALGTRNGARGHRRLARVVEVARQVWGSA